MCRLLGWVARNGLSLRYVLGEESYVAFAQLSRIYEDGWALAHANGCEIEVERSSTNASSDPGFAAMAVDVMARTAIGHPPLGISRTSGGVGTTRSSAASSCAASMS